MGGKFSEFATIRTADVVQHERGGPHLMMTMDWHKDVNDCVNQLKVGESYTQNLEECIDAMLLVAGVDRISRMKGKPICCFFNSDPRSTKWGTYVPVVTAVESLNGQHRYDFKDGV